MLEKINYNLPGIIDNSNFRYVLVDNIYVKSLIINNINGEFDFLEIIEAIPKNYEYDISIDIKKQDTMKVLKQLTYNISTSSSEIKTSSNNQIDIEILNKVKNDAKNLRKKIQIENEEVYFISIIITFFSNDLENLDYIVKSFQSKIYSKGLISSISNFRNLNSYLCSIPLFYYQKEFFLSNYLNVTTSFMANIFPFYEKTIFDKNGIILGFTKNENRMCCIDIFNLKYLNANMCILGSSGSGKSYFTKLLILKNYLMGTRQYIFDLENEYCSICECLNVCNINFFNSEYKINILEIFEYELENDLLENKIKKVTQFILDICNLENDEYYNKISDSLKLTYLKYGITNDKKSVLKKNSKDKIVIDKVLIDHENFPTISDFIKNISSIKLKNIIKKNFIEKYKAFDGITNVNLLDDIVVFSTSNIENYDLGVITNYLLSNINEVNKYKNDKNYIIYIDEVWKYINLPSNVNIEDELLKLYKSIRKNKGSIVIITQDISDFFKVRGGNLGKVILNNSGFKFFFRIDFADIDILKKISVIDDKIIDQILYLDKAETLFTFKNNKTILNIKASKFEKEILGGEYESSYSIK